MIHNAKKARNLAYLCLVAGFVGGMFVQFPSSEAEEVSVPMVPEAELWDMFELVRARERELETLRGTLSTYEEKSAG